VLQWFTGNIGYHHIHHLSARVPKEALIKLLSTRPRSGV
jgi:omega-6 fatty acid desaturase (delta-12 desaturase)